MAFVRLILGRIIYRCRDCSGFVRARKYDNVFPNGALWDVTALAVFFWLSDPASTLIFGLRARTLHFRQAWRLPLLPFAGSCRQRLTYCGGTGPGGAQAAHTLVIKDAPW